ncbi:MAG TPA: hypothetical protein PLH44_01535 [Bacilli bacterium]|jgi:nitrogen regulatory protein PII|nr:hypothetical protein [Bacilli bacterium]HOE06346.1 hypothetical protein [Bacilli bacterium]HOR17460.1 hypothetical protein [Bacilli bacterium]HPL55192.1 hypothetical protein [Bacilli bacterium]
MTDELQGMKLIITIVDRDKGEKVEEILSKCGVYYQLIMLGEGTAEQEILHLLGLSSLEKDVVLSFVEEDNVEEALNQLQGKLELNKQGKGITCVVDLDCIGGSKALQILLGREC